MSRMSVWLRAACCLVPLCFASPGRASPVSGFETGLGGWQVLGDVSVQTSAVGLAPTEGSQMAFVTTLCDPQVLGRGCDSGSEHPFSGTSSPEARLAREFLGLPSDIDAFIGAMPAFDASSGLTTGFGESGALKMRFYVDRAGTLSFDWNRLGVDNDTAYLSLWSDDGAYRVNDWLYNPALYTGTLSPSGVDMCMHGNGKTDPTAPCAADYGAFVNVETGWSTRSITIAAAGWYWIGFGLGEVAEGSGPTALALDNLRFDAPEPGTLALAALALAGLLAGGWRRERRSRAA